MISLNKVHFNVNGIQNNQIRTQLKNALSKVNGIQSINVDMERSTIDVGYNNKTNEFAIRDCIETVGCNIESSAF